MVRVMREYGSVHLFTQLTLSICTVLEKLLSYSQDSLYFFFDEYVTCVHVSGGYFVVRK